jgi:hypothetical protein
MRILTAAIAAFFMLAAPAIAQTIDTTAPVVDTVVQVPVGSIADTVLDYVQVAMAGLVIWALRLLPPQLYALAMTMRVDQLLSRAIAYAFNTVAGATEGKVLTVDVRNLVVKEAVTYALVHGGTLVKQFAGTPEELAEKIWSRMDLPQEASRPNLLGISAQASAIADAKSPGSSPMATDKA